MMITIITSILILSIIFIGLTKPKLLYYVMVFFAGWFSVFIDVGLMITAYRLVIIIFLLCLPIYFSLRKNAIKFPPSVRYLLIFVCYAITITIVSQFYAPESYIVGFARGEGRWIFQIAMLLIDVTPVFLPLLFFKKIEDVKTTAKVFVTSVIILCVLGWVQSLAFYLYGVALFPVFREGLTGAVTQVMDVNMFGVTFFRMHSLGGEPKDFAVTVAVAIVLLIMSKITDSKGFRFGNLLMGFFLISLFMSLATSGFFVLLMGLAFIVILPFFVKDLRPRFAFKSIAVIAVTTIIFFGIIIISGILPLDLIKELSLERTITRSPIELFDAAVISFLSKHPQYGLFGVGMGNIHLYAWDNLIQYASENPLAAWVFERSHDFVIVPNSGYLRIISELGIMGLILFLYAYLTPVRFNFKCRQYISDNNVKAIVLCLNLFSIFILVTFLMRYFQINYAYITLGLIYFLNRKIMPNFQPNIRR